jgi:hypothetical protein
VQQRKEWVDTSERWGCREPWGPRPQDQRTGTHCFYHMGRQLSTSGTFQRPPLTHRWTSPPPALGGHPPGRLSLVALMQGKNIPTHTRALPTLDTVLRRLVLPTAWGRSHQEEGKAHVICPLLCPPPAGTWLFLLGSLRALVLDLPPA